MGHRENTREVGRLQPKGRARDRACVERRHRRHELAWPGVTGQEGKHRGKSQRKWKQQPHGVSVCGSSQESLLFFGELGLFLSAGGPRLHCPGVLNHAGGLPCQWTVLCYEELTGLLEHMDYPFKIEKKPPPPKTEEHRSRNKREWRLGQRKEGRIQIGENTFSPEMCGQNNLRNPER